MMDFKFHDRGLGLLAFLTLLAFFSTHFSEAAEYPYLYRSAYFLGRGDAGIAIADDEDAIFYNPAGLARGKGIFKRVVFVSPTIELSSETRDVVREIALQESDPTEVLKEHIGSPQHFGLYNFSGVVLRRAALGGFVHTGTTVLLGRDPEKGGFETVKANFIGEGGAVFSLADSMFSRNFYVGLTAKFISRTQGGLSASASDADQVRELQSDELAMSGTGGGVDLGMLYETGGRTPFSFGLTINDVGGTAFTPSLPTTVPKAKRPLKDIEQTVNVGVAIAPGTRASKIKLVLDYRDVLSAVEESSFKRVHIGTEISVLDVVGVTAGLNQGYGTFGFYIDSRFFRLDLGVYTEEIGNHVGIRSDPRYFFRFLVGL